MPVIQQGVSQQTAAAQQVWRTSGGSRSGSRRAGKKRKRTGTSRRRASSTRRRASSGKKRKSKLVKGSAAAKRYMAKIRKMRK